MISKNDQEQLHSAQGAQNRKQGQTYPVKRRPDKRGPRFNKFHGTTVGPCEVCTASSWTEKTTRLWIGGSINSGIHRNTPEEFERSGSDGKRGSGKNSRREEVLSPGPGRNMRQSPTWLKAWTRFQVTEDTEKVAARSGDKDERWYQANTIVGHI